MRRVTKTALAACCLMMSQGGVAGTEADTVVPHVAISGHHGRTVAASVGGSASDTGPLEVDTVSSSWMTDSVIYKTTCEAVQVRIPGEAGLWVRIASCAPKEAGALGVHGDIRVFREPKNVDPATPWPFNSPEILTHATCGSTRLHIETETEIPLGKHREFSIGDATIDFWCD